MKHNYKNTPWTEEISARAHAMWDAGNSASIIANAISTHEVSISRNAVIGRAHRQHWELPGRRVAIKVVREPRKSGPKMRPRRPSYNMVSSMLMKPVAPTPIVEPDVTDMNLVSFADRKYDGCCWPIGDPLDPGFGFCDSDRIEGSSYCAGHRHKSIQHVSLPRRYAVRPFRR